MQRNILANELYDKGRANEAQGNYAQAIEYYTHAIKLNPNFAAAYVGRGNAYYGRDDNWVKRELDEAIADYTRAIELDPKLATAYRGRGKAYYSRDQHNGKLDRAIADYTRAIELDPQYTAAYVDRGNAYCVREPWVEVYYSPVKLAEAMADFEHAIELDPKFAGAYNGQGIVHYAQGKFAEAIVDYTRAIELDPKLARAYNGRGNAYRAQGKLAEALQDYLHCLRLKTGQGDYDLRFLLANSSPKKIFNSIKALPPDEIKFSLLKECLFGRLNSRFHTGLFMDSPLPIVKDIEAEYRLLGSVLDARAAADAVFKAKHALNHEGSIQANVAIGKLSQALQEHKDQETPTVKDLLKQKQKWVAEKEKRIQILVAEFKQIAEIARRKIKACLEGLPAKPEYPTLRQEVEKLQDEFLWREACWLQENLQVNDAIDKLLALPAENPHYAEAHFSAFQLAYSCQLSDASETDKKAAFMTALPCCLNAKEELLSLSINDQRIFDGYLIAATGGKNIPGESLLAVDKRLTLLQYLLLQEIKAEASRLSTQRTGHTLFDTKQSHAGIVEHLSQLPETMEAGNLDQNDIHQLWQEACEQLKNSPLDNVNTQALINAITRFATTVYAPEPAKPAPS